MILLSHATPGVMIRHTARALERAGMLGEFWSYVNVRGDCVLRCIEAPPPCSLDAAVLAPVPLDAVMPEPSALAIDDPPTAPPDDAATEWLDQEMSARLHHATFTGVFAPAGAADATFRAAGQRGLLRVYNLPVARWQGSHRILRDEAAREPEWASTLAPSPSANQLARHESEVRQADLVLVTSTFGITALDEVQDLAAPIAVAAPGILPPFCPLPPAARSARSVRPLRVIFAGALGQRAGLSYLFRACHTLRRAVSLTIIGEPPRQSCLPLERALRDVRWLPTCAPEEIRREMATHDVFVFPAVFDNGSYLLREALAMGLPIVATPQSAAVDLIEDGKEGYIIPASSTEALIERLELLHREPEHRAEMARQALRRAAGQTWERYEQTIASSIAAALGTR